MISYVCVLTKTDIRFVVPFMQIALGVYLLFKTGATDVLASAVKRS